MTIKGKLLSVVAALVVTSSFASSNHHKQHGFYVGLGAGARHNSTYSLEASEVNADNAEGRFVGIFSEMESITEDTTRWTPWGWSASAFAGYQFNQTWSLQLGYDYDQKQHLKGMVSIRIWDGFSSSYEIEDPRETVLELKTHDWYVAVRAALPLTHDWSAYFMVGPAQTRLSQRLIYTDAEDENTYESGRFWSPMAAAGVTYAFDSCLDVGLQYTQVLAYHKSVEVNDLRKNYTGTQRIALTTSYHF